MRAFKTLAVAAAIFAMSHPVMAQTDPHHPAGAEATTIEEAPSDAPEAVTPNVPTEPMMGCSDMMGSMGMMQMTQMTQMTEMMQSMQVTQSMQMEMMQRMLEMQKALAASPLPAEGVSP